MCVITSKFGGFLVYTSKAMYQYWKTNVNTRLLSTIFFLLNINTNFFLEYFYEKEVHGIHQCKNKWIKDEFDYVKEYETYSNRVFLHEYLKFAHMHKSTKKNESSAYLYI